MLRKSLTVLTLLLGSSLSAAGHHPEPGHFGFSADYLYYLPSIDDSYFVVSADDLETEGVLDGHRECHQFKFTSGYRVAAAYAFCDCGRELDVAYTRLHTKQNKWVAGDRLFATIDPFLNEDFQDYSGVAGSRLDLGYSRVDGLFTQQVYNCCGADVRLDFGVEYAHLHLNEKAVYIEGEGDEILEGFWRHDSHTWAVGPQIGFEVDYSLYRFDGSCGLPGVLSLNVVSTGSLLAGQVGTSYRHLVPGDPDSLYNINDCKVWRVIPAFHARVGLAYATEFCGNSASLEVGYAFDTYLRALSKTRYLNGAGDDAPQLLSFTGYNNFDAQGLYVSAGFTF